MRNSSGLLIIGLALCLAGFLAFQDRIHYDNPPDPPPPPAAPHAPQAPDAPPAPPATTSGDDSQVILPQIPAVPAVPPAPDLKELPAPPAPPPAPELPADVKKFMKANPTVRSISWSSSPLTFIVRYKGGGSDSFRLDDESQRQEALRKFGSLPEAPAEPPANKQNQ